MSSNAMVTAAELPSWETMMEDTNRAVNTLDMIYGRCLRMVDSMKSGGGSLTDLEGLLNQSIPATEEDRRLAFTITFMARIKLGPLVNYLFGIRRACLLLLVDGPAAVIALNVGGLLDIWTGDDGSFHVDHSKGGGAPVTVSHFDRDHGHANRHANNGRRGGRSDRGDRANGRRGGRANVSKDAPRQRGPARGAATGKPVMGMDECYQVLADIGGDDGEVVAATGSPTYLDAATGKTRAADEITTNGKTDAAAMPLKMTKSIVTASPGDKMKATPIAAPTSAQENDATVVDVTQVPTEEEQNDADTTQETNEEKNAVSAAPKEEETPISTKDEPIAKGNAGRADNIQSSPIAWADMTDDDIPVVAATPTTVAKPTTAKATSAKIPADFTVVGRGKSRAGEKRR